jgi:hypothetical protein
MPACGEKHTQTHVIGNFDATMLAKKALTEAAN